MGARASERQDLHLLHPRIADRAPRRKSAEQASSKRHRSAIAGPEAQQRADHALAGADAGDRFPCRAFRRRDPDSWGRSWSSGAGRPQADASVTVAQAILETGWGKHTVGEAKNLFS